MQVGEWLRQARTVLEGVAVSEKDSDRRTAEADRTAGADKTAMNRDIQVLAAHVLGKPRAWLLAHPEAELAPSQAEQLDGLLARLAQGEPLPYLIGHWEFYGLDFEVTPDVLIPRPETELLVEYGLAWLGRHPALRRAADVGCGSGCIGIALAVNAPGLRLLAVDRSRAALKVARRNSLRHQMMERASFVQGDLLGAIRGPLDLVCANLPYIPEPALDGLAVARYEPRMALGGGADGLRFIRALIADAPRWLAPHGLLLLEMQMDQGAAITRLAQQALPGARVAVLRDLAGLERVVAIENGG